MVMMLMALMLRHVKTGKRKRGSWNLWLRQEMMMQLFDVKWRNELILFSVLLEIRRKGRSRMIIFLLADVDDIRLAELAKYYFDFDDHVTTDCLCFFCKSSVFVVAVEFDDFLFGCSFVAAFGSFVVAADWHKRRPKLMSRTALCCYCCYFQWTMAFKNHLRKEKSGWLLVILFYSHSYSGDIDNEDDDSEEG